MESTPVEPTRETGPLGTWSACLRWSALAVAVGVLVGLVGAAFSHVLAWAALTRQARPWLVYALPLGGVVIVGLYRLCRREDDLGANDVLLAVREGGSLPLVTAPLIFISTALTHLLGGSAGREGAALQLGGSLAAGASKLLKLDGDGRRVVTMCGMAAGFSALFGAPLTAALFAMEVHSVGIFYHAAWVPCLLASFAAHLVAVPLGGEVLSFPLEGLPALSPLTLLQAAGMGVLCALLAVAVCRALHLAPRLYARLLPSPYARVVLGGCLVALLTFLVGSQDYNGPGGPVIAQAMAGRAEPLAFALKLLFTALTLGAGYKGGEIVPVLFMGSTFGCVAGPLLGLPAPLGAGLGMAALFCGVTNCPLSSLMLSYELFGPEALPLCALATALSYALSGYTGLYDGQRIAVSKLHPELLDQITKSGG